MPEQTKSLDEVLAENDSLRGQIKAFETRFATLEQAQAKAPTSDAIASAVNAATAPLQAEIASLKTEITGLKAKDQNFERTVAEQVAKLGISSQVPGAKPTEAGGKQADGEKLTLTQQCLKAKNLPYN